MGSPPSVSRISSDAFSGDWGQDSEALVSSINRFMGDSTSLFSGQLRLAANLGCMIWTAKISTPSPWTAPTFSGTWANTGSFVTAYRVNQDGTVSVRGNVSGGTLGTTIFTLPSALKPPQDFNVPTEASSAFGKLLVEATTGNVKHVTGSVSAVSLDGIRFEPATTVPYAASCFPISKQSTLPNQLANAVQVGLVQDLTPGVNPISIAPGGCAWRNSNGNVVIDNIPGLLPNRVYGVVFIAYPAK